MRRARRVRPAEIVVDRDELDRRLTTLAINNGAQLGEFTPDAGKARRELGWRPTSLEDGLRATLDA